MHNSSAGSRRTGVTHGILAYTAWGLLPLYFKAIKQAPPLEILSHRIVWALVFSAILMTWTRAWAGGLEALRRPRSALYLLCSSLLIAVNWFIYIWAVENEHVLEASFGYYINPLVNVLLGVVFLRERLRPLQATSVALACIGVAIMSLQLGTFPWLALLLASTFGFYGLVRKVAHVESLAGVTFECVVLMPPAVAYLIWLALTGKGALPWAGPRMSILLLLAGPITAMPLVWFASAARRLRLATLGFIQYVSPSMQFLLAVAVFGEPFSMMHLVAFAFIWTALAIFTCDALRQNRIMVEAV